MENFSSKSLHESIISSKQKAIHLKLEKRMHKIEAAAVLITIGNKIVAFRRIKDGKLGLPCGKVEAGETIQQTAVRECFEETGLTIAIIGEPFIDFEAEYQVATFRATILKEGLPTNAHEGHMILVDAIDLINGGFGEYNKKAFDHFQIKH
jgi:8-oxo-dGTP pyrophosphatase MutT (NUDIX family)